MESIKYEYMRTVTREHVNDEDLFIGYISLTKYLLLKQKPYLQYERAEQINSNFIRKLKDTPSLLAQIPEGDITYNLTEDMYNQLVNSYFTNPEWLWTYMVSFQT